MAGPHKAGRSGSEEKPRVHVVGNVLTEVKKHRLPHESEESQAATLKKFLEGEWHGEEGPRDIDYYFNSYSHMGIHEEMLKDRVRTSAYYYAMMNNRHAFQDKVVLDVGAGTGILSMFAAKAGAKHVYAVEYSDIAMVARQVIKSNHLDDVITVIQGKAEEVELPVAKVDVIISEWMGYFLLYESMLDSVILCRDKWLVEGGLLFPNKVSLHLCGLEDTEYRDERFAFWQNVFSIDYSVVVPSIMAEPTIEVVHQDGLVTDTSCIAEFDLKTVTRQQLDFASPYKLTATRHDYIHAFVGWFDCMFSDGVHVPVAFSTSPRAEYTHWKQTIFYLKDPLPIKRGEAVEGIIAVRKNASNSRAIDVKLQYRFNGDNLTCNQCQLFHIR